MLLGETLTKSFGIQPEEVEKALRFQAQFGGRLGSILVNMGVISEETLVRALSEQLGLEHLRTEDQAVICFEHLGEASKTLNVDFVLARKAIPISCCGGKFVFATTDTLNLELQAYLAESGIDATCILCTETQLRDLSMRLRGQGGSEQKWGEAIDLMTGDIEKLRELASEAPIVNLVNTLIARALGKRASDLHFEPYKNMYRVRIRVDGMLHDIDFLPFDMQLPVSSRIKILAGLDIAEKRKPQDGKISLRIASQELDIRVSTLPLGNGESIVMRFLLKESIQYDLDVLGLSGDLLEKLNRDILKPNGVILLTGPTGSGKTTTLYSALNRVNSEDKKIITVEDPIEYQLDGINQLQVNPDIGYDFPTALRSIVRQDPDVIMVGEIRDRETARIAMQASLTGHLVFSTLHTNDSPSAFTRLMDLGIEEYLLNAALVSIIAQRLIRKLCPHCRKKTPKPPSLEIPRTVSEYMREKGVAGEFIFEPAGCGHCNMTGYSGRVAIMEYMSHDDRLKSMEKDSHFVQNARAYLAETGTRSLYEEGLVKVLCGITSLQEVVRVAGQE